MKNIRTTIGGNHGKAHSRIWLEGARLVAAKFTVGARYNRIEGTGALVLALNAAGKYKVSGKGEKPIIDTTGQIVARLFPSPLTHALPRGASRSAQNPSRANPEPLTPPRKEA